MIKVGDLQCPIDGGKVILNNGSYYCMSCDLIFPKAKVNDHSVTDFRCLDRITSVTLNFDIPQAPLKTGEVHTFGIATNAKFNHISREVARKKYGSKLQKEIFYYINDLHTCIGANAFILDMGCGNAGNKNYLQSVGFNNILSVDYFSEGAEFFVDVHRLPFSDGIFDMIITTATLEHFYNPFIAFKEISRVLKKDGRLIASGSFWESWHGNSCFHFTPGGLDILCKSSNLQLLDLWSGWGFIPSVASHAFGMGRLKKYTYCIQRCFNYIIKMVANSNAAKIHTYRTSGSFGLYAKKINAEKQ